MRLGVLLKNYREEHRLSMATFAERTGLSKGYISMLERGTDNRTGKPIVPSLLTIRKVANGMEMPFDKLFNAIDDCELVSIASDYEELHDEKAIRYLAKEINRPTVNMLIATVKDLSDKEINEIIEISKIIGRRGKKR